MSQLERVAQAMVVIAAFAAANERAIELIRKIVDKWPSAKAWIEALTVGPFGVLPGTVLALLTQANLLALFHEVPLGDKMVDFFGLYLQPPFAVFRDMAPDVWLRHLVGCVLMGFAVSLGSQYWHDVGKGLIDVRDKLKVPGVRPAPASAQLADRGARARRSKRSRREGETR